MRPRIDEFYLDSGLGHLKFKGYDGENYLFSTYTKYLEDWSVAENSVRLNPGDFDIRIKQGHIVKTYAPR